MRRFEIYYDDVLLDLPDNEVAPITKQVNEIGDLNVFKSDFTHEFRVLRTRKMNQLFENVGVLGYQTDMPYEKLDVKVISEGIEVLPKGKMMINRVDHEYIHCSIYSGARDLFAELNKRQFTSLDLSDLDHTWTAEVARNSVLNDEDYQYPFADFSDDGKLIETDTTPATELIAEERILRPWVRASRLFNDILADVTLVSDIATDELFLALFICANTLKPPKSATIPYQVERYHDGETRLAVPRIHLGNYTISDDKAVSNALEYTAKFDGEFGFSFTIPSGLGLTSIYVKVNEGTGSEQTLNPENTITPDGYYFTVELETNDVVRFFYNGSLPSVDYTFRCYDIEGEQIGVGSPVITGAHLPPMKQDDYIKAICKYFGLVPDYDGVTNTLTLWSINRLLTNRRIAKNWSAYLDQGSMDLSFRMDYAKKNHMKWEPDDDVPEGSGDAFIGVNDENLIMDKELMNMPFSFSDEVSHGGQAMCRIGWFESIPGSVEYKELEGIAPRIGRLVTCEDLQTTYRTSTSPATDYSNNAGNGAVIRVNGLDMTVSIGYNNAIVRMLRQSKVLKLRFNLPELEITRLKHYVPVYLEQYDAVFFVKRVENWVSGELCNVELIRI